MIDLVKERKSFEKTCTKHGANIGNNMHTEDNFKTWCLRAELAQAEITELKQKLARYENPDYVLLPRKLTNRVIKEAERWHSCIEISSDNEINYIYEGIIEAVEKDDVP